MKLLCRKSSRFAVAVSSAKLAIGRCALILACLLLARATLARAETPFAPLHIYHISANGDDRRSGLSADDAWATPNHEVECGDVIVVAAGTYDHGQFGANSWGRVSNCPSAKTGVYFAVLLCAGPSIASCRVDGRANEGFRVDKSNWAVEGFTATQRRAGIFSCFTATSETNETLHHIAFINNIAASCQISGFATFSWTKPGGVDQTAVVGAIAYDASPSINDGICGSGVSIIPAEGPDSTPGTHIFVAGYFGYGNINAKAGAGCNTDGEGLIFDSWACSTYRHQGAAEQNVWWGNGNAGFLVFPNCPEKPDRSKVYVFGNTSIGNAQDTERKDAAAELLVNQARPSSEAGTEYSVFDNIFVSTERTSGGAGKAQVFVAGVYMNGERNLISVRDNYFWHAHADAKPQVGVPFTDVWLNGVHDKTSFPFGRNTYADPGFSRAIRLPSAAPRCEDYANTTDCMNLGYHVASDLTPSGGAAGIGYKPPGPCAPDPYFPVWLKGVVHLRWTNKGVMQESGLINLPCGM